MYRALLLNEKFSCSLVFVLNRNIVTFDALSENLRHASTIYWS